MGIEKKLLKELDDERNKRSLELFNKPLIELQISEIMKLDQYMYDREHPIWKPIVFNGKNTGYQISNISEIRGIRGYNLKKDIGNTGYYRVNGYYDKHSIHMTIHILVATTFIPNPENKPIVNHINGNKTCNWWRNLEWITQHENMEHAIRTGLIDVKGEKHPENVYSEGQVRMACKLLENPKNKISDIVEASGINRSILYSIRTGHSWSHISSEYQIPRPRVQLEFPEENLNEAAKLLSENKTYDDISNKTGIPTRTLIKIVYGSPKYANLNSIYNISKNRCLKSKNAYKYK